MSWWKRSITVMLVPHSGGSSFSLSLPIWMLLTLLVLLVSPVILFVGATLLGWTGVYPETNLLTNRNQGITNQNPVVKSLETQLQKTQEHYQEVLRLTGFDDYALADTVPASSKLSRESDTTLQQKLELVLNQNQQLSRIRELLKNRNRIFRHTPTLWPTKGWISSPYGKRQDPMGGSGRNRHHGIDIAAWHGSPIRSPAAGEVIEVSWKGGYGRTVVIRHEFGYKTLYGHLSKTLVKEDQRVRKGSLIARVGQSGQTTGSHLHYEIQINNEAINPWPYLIEDYKAFKHYQ